VDFLLAGAVSDDEGKSFVKVRNSASNYANSLQINCVPIYRKAANFLSGTGDFQVPRFQQRKLHILCRGEVLAVLKAFQMTEIRASDVEMGGHTGCEVFFTSVLQFTFLI
jgi:hypothetical protein